MDPRIDQRRALLAIGVLLGHAIDLAQLSSATPSGTIFSIAMATALLRVRLRRPDGDGQARAVGSQFAGRVGLFQRVDDVEASYRRMMAAGVRFLTPPHDEPYGRVAVFLVLLDPGW